MSSRDTQKNSNKRTDRQLAGQSSLTQCMSIKDEYISKKVTFDMQDSLDDKIDRLTLMMSKLTTEDDNQNKQFKPRIYQNKWRGQPRNFTIEIVMFREIIKIDIGQIAEIEGHQTEVEVSIDRIIEEDCIMLITLELIIEEIISEICRIIEVKVLKVDMEGNIKMIILEELGVGLETGNIQAILEGMIEVVVGLDQVQEPALIGIELVAINIGNMIILLRTVQLHK